jgi:Family of unknown function (DUF6178)
MTPPTELVKRLLDTEGIARVVPRLAPEVLHRVIERCGLDDCVELVALATPRQLDRVLDLDLWRAPVPGADESLDAARFGHWIEVLLQSGPAIAGDKLAGMDRGLVVGGLMEHVRVFDGAVTESYTMLHGEEIQGRTLTGPVSQIGGYVIEGRETQAWDAIVELLAHLQEDRPALFHRLMRGCVAVSDEGREEDGFHALLDTRDQYRSDLAAGRETRRDAQGYVAPAQARAFLQASRETALNGARPPTDSVARACLRDITPEPRVEDDPRAPQTGSADLDTAPFEASSHGAGDAHAMTTVMEMLTDAGVMTPPRALIGAGDADDSRLGLVRACVESRSTAPEDLAFLANALLAGCSIQDRPFTPQEVSDAVLATCNLGLENWPDGWGDRDLVTAFQVGWAVLHRDLCRHAATTVIDVLEDLECDDRDVQGSLQTLRRALLRHAANGEPWRARPALDAILMLDPPAWAVLLALVAECPTLHAALTTRGRTRVDPSAFAFVARNSEIASARQYLASLATTLTG